MPPIFNVPAPEELAKSSKALPPIEISPPTVNAQVPVPDDNQKLVLVPESVKLPPTDTVIFVFAVNACLITPVPVDCMIRFP